MNQNLDKNNRLNITNFMIYRTNPGQNKISKILSLKFIPFKINKIVLYEFHETVFNFVQHKYFFKFIRRGLTKGIFYSKKSDERKVIIKFWK